MESRPFRPGASTEDDRQRCFYAVRLDSATNNYLASIIEELRRHGADVGWVSQSNLHLTLRFLGPISNRQFQDARAYAAGMPSPGSLSLCASGLGAFPTLRSPSVLWAGLDGESPDDLDRLRNLQQTTEAWARALGLQPEHRRFSPHITLGRVRRPGKGLKELIEDITVRECRSGFSRVGELLLMRSTLTGEGAKYDVVDSWTLTNS